MAVRYRPDGRLLAEHSGVGGSQPGRPVTTNQIAAVDEAIAEIGLIADPHKAIDWLSTFPHVVALALGGDVDDDDLSTGGSGPER